ncbi:hypothetical protein [Cyanobium sp. T1G-Tous]|uniref:hypothetical protein n=1 Tax=Cyanobium sp. T1G-Tous TaxID=2823722 RepID=UPI0020CD5C8C|nr:hypothetical protein [Cyanobium sp. T1G-Tous]
MAMAWEPSVLRKYNTTGHFRLLSQLRSELKGNPLVRPKEGQSIGEVNRSKSLIRAIEGRSQGYGRGRRGGAAITAGASSASPDVQQLKLDPDPFELVSSMASDHGDVASFRERLNTVELR